MFRMITVTLSAAAALAACGGGQSAQGAAPVAEPGPATPTAEDQRIELDTLELQGMRFEPEALGYPPMPRVGGMAPRLARARALAGRTKPKPADVHVLVSLLYADAAKREAEGDADGAAAARSEARAALRGLRERSGDDADATTLEMTAVAAARDGEHDDAIAAYRALLERFPEHEGATAFRTWLAFLLVKAHRSAEAAEVLADIDLATAPPMSAYVAAWAAHRRGDHAGARALIGQAAAGWDDQATWPAVERDMLLLLSRGAAPIDEAAAIFATVAGEGDARRPYVWMFTLSEGLKFAGYYQLAADALAHALAQGAGDAEPSGEDRVGVRFRQADYAFRENDAARAARFAIEAHEGLAACGDPCAGETAEAVAQRVSRLAQFFHKSYAASFDPAHFDAAVALYEYYVTIPGRGDSDAMQSYLANLRDTQANAKPQNGKHSDEILGPLVQARREALSACYEHQRGRQPELQGTVMLTLEIDPTGAVAGSATEPAAGDAGMGAVAACVGTRARRWSFPSRTAPGTTTLRVPAQFSPRQAAEG